jgi:hypothetical protein
MTARYLLILLLLGCVAASAQQETNSAEPGSDADESRMAVPPPVSGVAYPTDTASQTRSNYVRAGLTLNTAYTDNLLGGAGPKPVSDISYSAFPTFALDETSSRLQAVLTYSPGFTFYEKTSSYNQQNQNVAADFQYRLSPHVTVSFLDSFHKLSNIFDQPDLLAATPVSGTAQPSPVNVIAPIANQLTNASNAELTYQFSRNGMFGTSGNFTDLHFSDPTQAKGLYDSNSMGGSAFYSHRLSKKNYLGATYQYERIIAYPSGGENETLTQTISLFYTLYVRSNFSLSFTGGPQHYQVSQPVLPTSAAWTPSGTFSLGWQARRMNIAASYSRMVTGGGGLTGAYHSNMANASVREQLTRNWNAGVSGAYSIYKTVDSFFFPSNPGGHTVSGGVSVQRQFGAHVNAELGYTRFYQSYSGIAAISTFPNVNREWISISYQFSRPLGR